MRVLVFGGTQFVGRHIVLSARAAGLDVILFNRGKTNPELFSDLERIVGDREADLERLGSRSFDAVIDVNGYVPRIVGAAADALSGRVRQYVFVSSVGVYGLPGPDGPDENTPVATLDEDTEEVTGETYGALKALCEKAVRDRFGKQALVVRPGLVVGPHDPTERFIRWVRRAAGGGAMLAPGGPDHPYQVIDARDLADWIIRMVLAEAGGTFNAVGPPTTMGTVLHTCVAVTGADTRLEWVDAPTLAEHGIRPWVDLPGWLSPERSGMARAAVSRALRAGLTIRPLEDTVRAAWRWDRSRTDAGEAGLPVDRERELLATLRDGGG